MNKILKCAFGLLTLITLNIAYFSSADYTLPLDGFEGNNVENGAIVYIGQNVDKYNQKLTLSSNYDFYCFIRLNRNNGGQYSFDNSTWYNGPNYNVYCDNRDIYIKSNGFLFYYYKFGQGMIPSQYTSLQCQTEYNLIPIEEVTANYCRLNFDLIDPAECPINSGTGAIVRSNLMINDIPYAQNQNINVFIPDFLKWNIAFNDFNTVIEIEGYNADEEYINNVINNEKVTPTPQDFTYFIHGLADFIPYIFIGLLLLFAVKVFGKVWK